MRRHVVCIHVLKKLSVGVSHILPLLSVSRKGRTRSHPLRSRSIDAVRIYVDLKPRPASAFDIQSSPWLPLASERSLGHL